MKTWKRSMEVKLDVIEGEEWRDIIGYEGFYKVSNLGRVISMKNANRNGIRERDTPILRSQKTGKDRRKRVRLGFADIHIDKMWLVHVLVANAFTPNNNPKLQINHKDGNPANNTVGNLEWVTASENIIHGQHAGLFRNRVRGERQALSKLDATAVREIIESELSNLKLGTKYGVSAHSVFSVRRGISWNHITGLPRKTTSRK